MKRLDWPPKACPCCGRGSLPGVPGLRGPGRAVIGAGGEWICRYCRAWAERALRLYYQATTR